MTTASPLITPWRISSGKCSHRRRLLRPIRLNRRTRRRRHMAHADLSGEVQTIRDTIGTMQSATALISTFAQRQQAAIDAALENGATAAELQPLTDLQASLVATQSDLAAAVAANP